MLSRNRSPDKVTLTATTTPSHFFQSREVSPHLSSEGTRRPPPEKENKDDFWGRMFDGAAKTPFSAMLEPTLQPRPDSWLQGNICGIEDADIPPAKLIGVICAAWAVVLSYRTESQDTIFGLRSTPELGGHDGDLPICIRVDRYQQLSEFLESVGQLSQAKRTFSSSIDSTNPVRAIYDFQSVVSFCFGHGKPSQTELSVRRALVLECQISSNKLLLGAQYDSRFIRREEVHLVLGDLEHLVWQLLQPVNDHRTVRDLEVLSPAARRQLLRFNRP